MLFIQRGVYLKNLIILLYSFFFTVPAFAQVDYAVIRQSDGTVRLHNRYYKDGVEKIAKNSNLEATVRYNNTGTTYATKAEILPKLRGTTGAVSTDVLKGTVTQTIPKKAVTSAVAKNAFKAVGKGLAKGLVKSIPFVGQAYAIYDELARENGYTEECEQGMCKTVTDNETYAVIMTKQRYNGLTHAALSHVEFDTLCKELKCYNPSFVKGFQEASQAAIEKCRTVDAFGQPADGYDAQGTCTRGNFYGTDVAVKMIPIKDKIPFTESDFMGVAEAAADKAIEKWLEAAGGDDPLPWSEPKVYLLPGQIAQSNPYTNPETGKPEQARWKVVDDPDAPGQNSKIEEEIIPRPDLKPNSPEAPAVSPDTATADDTATDTGRDKDKTDDKQPPTDTEDLCEKNPDILACDKVPDDKPSASEPNFSIPEKVVDIHFKPDTIFPDNGVCPAPVSFDISIAGSSKTFAFSYEYVCDVAAKLRGLLIAVAWLVVAFFATKALRNA
ncbi:IgG-binding virulence factor TspB family protein [Neisseriaceae bacterium B1]